MLHTHVIASSVVRAIVFLTSHVFLLFRHHGTAPIDGSGNGVGTKLGDGIVSTVLPEYVEQMGIFLAQIFPTGLDRHSLQQHRLHYVARYALDVCHVFSS